MNNFKRWLFWFGLKSAPHSVILRSWTSSNICQWTGNFQNKHLTQTLSNLSNSTIHPPSNEVHNWITGTQAAQVSIVKGNSNYLWFCISYVLLNLGHYLQDYFFVSDSLFIYSLINLFIYSNYKICHYWCHVWLLFYKLIEWLCKCSVKLCLISFS